MVVNKSQKIQNWNRSEGKHLVSTQSIYFVQILKYKHLRFNS